MRRSAKERAEGHGVQRGAAERLGRIELLWRDGLISDQEREESRKRVLGDL